MGNQVSTPGGGRRRGRNKHTKRMRMAAMDDPAAALASASAAGAAAAPGQHGTASPLHTHESTVNNAQRRTRLPFGGLKAPGHAPSPGAAPSADGRLQQGNEYYAQGHPGHGLAPEYHGHPGDATMDVDQRSGLEDDAAINRLPGAHGGAPDNDGYHQRRPPPMNATNQPFDTATAGVRDANRARVAAHGERDKINDANAPMKPSPAAPTPPLPDSDALGNPAGPSTPSSGSSKYGRPEKLGLVRKEFVNVHRRNYTGRIELLQGSVEGLSAADETDLLIVYLRERGQYKANRDSSLAALNRCGISLRDMERASRPEPSYRRHYHCWLSRPIPKPRPVGFEYKRLLVYEDPGEELTRDDKIVLHIMKCLTTVIGGDVQISSVLLPLSGALLSPSLRKHFVKAAVEVSYAWMRMGLPLRTVKILLPDTDITKDIETFRKTRAKLMQTSIIPMVPTRSHDVYFSYAHADAAAATRMIEYLKSKNPSIKIHDAKPRDIEVRKRGVVDSEMMTAISESRVFLALLSDDYFGSIECTETFSLAYCRDFDAQGNFIVPLWWRTCDITPLARRLVHTEGVDCRERSFENAKTLLEEILVALASVGVGTANPTPDVVYDDQGNAQSPPMERVDCSNLKIADKLLMMKEDAGAMMFEEANHAEAEQEETVSQMFFDKHWRSQFNIDHRQIVFGPRIGAGGFGEVYKCKYENRMVAVKTLRHPEDDEPQHVMAEFMVEMKLMSKLKHPNIVSFVGACIHNPHLAIVLEFMPGGSLYRALYRRRRNQFGPFPLLKTVWIAYGVAKGMYYLHSRNPVVIHRDLKSPNVLLGTNVREVKVTDFGLSRLRVKTFVNTGPGGTPEWMAPELLRQDKFNEMSDVFSFGVILWELVMCEKPWKDDHPMQIVFKVGSRGEKLPTPPPDMCEPELREMIVACFADDPKRRPTFAEIVDTLDQLSHRVEIS